MVPAPRDPVDHALDFYIGFYSRVLRSALIEADGEDFVRTARAKGICERRVLVATRCGPR